METFLLFTYGTLMRGQRNEHLLNDARYICKAQTTKNYKLFRIDGNFVFPALADDGDISITGEIYEVPISALSAMDRMEGHPHFYCRKPIAIDNSSIIDNNEVIAYFFVNKETLLHYPEIKSGDWLNQ